MGLRKLVARIIHKIVRLAFYGLQLIIWIRTFCAPFKKSRRIPLIKNDLLLLSATQLAEKIRNREVKCVDVLEAYIQRIEEVNPILNSVIQDRFDEARNEAKTVDEMIETVSDSSMWEIKKPLLGVPLTVKETIGVKGMSNNAARSRVQSNIAARDAESIILLKDAGAIPILVSNIPELCLYWETFNPKHGTTNNPYDTRRTPGGSSGGEAALLGAGASVIGVGSDIAGSVRLPALFCGIFGHKPTPGYITIDGHIPSAADPRWNDYFVLGPLTRYAEDLPIMVKTMIPKRNNPEDLLLDDFVDVSKLRIFYMDGEGPEGILCDPVTKDMKRALHRAVNCLKTDYKNEASKIEIKEVADSLALSCLILRINNVETIFQKDDDHPDDWNNMLVEMWNKMIGKSQASPTAVLYGPLKILVDLIPQREIKRIEKKKEQLLTKFSETLGDDGVLLYPTFPWVAPYHLRMTSQFLNSSYMVLFTLLGLPVTQCPLGLNKDGLPVGIQIVAARKQDRLCMAVAKALEKGCGGWKPPRPD